MHMHPLDDPSYISYRAIVPAFYPDEDSFEARTPNVLGSVSARQ